MAVCGLPAFEKQFAIRRLRLFSRILRFAPDFLLLLLDLAGDLRRRLVQDARWLRSQTSKLEQLPDPDLDFEVWMRLACESPAA